jgi:hypothetical protein
MEYEVPHGASGNSSKDIHTLESISAKVQHPRVRSISKVRLKVEQKLQ